MSISGGLLLSSPNISFGDLCVPLVIPKSYSAGFMYEGSGKLLFSEGSYVNNGSKVFSAGFLLGAREVLGGQPYARIYPNKTYLNGFLTTVSARPGLRTDTGFLLVNGFYTDFEANPRNLLAGDLVEFQDYTYGPAISGWYWSFGDGTFSTDQYPVHAYSAAGLYTVELTVTSINGEEVSNRKPNYISVTELAAGKKKLYLVASNQRVTPYKAGTDDQIQVKFQLFGDNKTRLSYLNDVPLKLKLNYSGWQSYETSTTDKTGSQVMYHSCVGISGVSSCLGYVVATIDGKIYKSNITRFNFI